jgi:hypothetical protein
MQRFLLDVWAEPREVESLPAVVRGRVRDMTTDEVHHVGSWAEVGAVIESRLDAELPLWRWERP